MNGHTLKVTKQPDGKYVGRCSCGKWMGFGKTERYVRGQWDKKHINPMDNWK